MPKLIRDWLESNRILVAAPAVLQSATARVEYYAWYGAKRRCFDPRHKMFRHYGGRGIRMCERWRRFSNFLEDMGPRPPGMTLDRIDNDGDYEPANCRWATTAQQSRNRRITVMVEHDGKRVTLADLAEAYDIEYPTLWWRVCRLGWSVGDALAKPVRTCTRGSERRRSGKL